MQLVRAPHMRGALSSRNSSFASQTSFKVRFVTLRSSVPGMGPQTLVY